MAKSQTAPKIGQSHLSAWLRAGAKELAQALPATKDSIQVVEETGLFGTALPQEVFEERKSQEAHIDQNIEMEM